MSNWNNIKWYIDSKIKDLETDLKKQLDERLKRIEDKLERQEDYEMEMKERNEQ